MTNADIRALLRDEKRSQRFKERERELVKLLLRIDPIMGTQLGIEGEHDGQLPPADSAARDGLLDGLAQASSLFGEVGFMGVDEVIDQQLAVSGVRSLQVFNSALRSHERNPGWYLETAMSGLHSLLMRSDMPMEEKASRVGQRLAAIPAHFAVGKAQIQRPPSVLLETAEGDIPGAIEFCRDSLVEFIATVENGAAQAELQRQQRACLESLEDFGEYVRGQSEHSVADFAIGKEAFNQLLAGSLVPHDADTLFELGEKVASDLERELEEISLQTANRPEWWLTLEALAAHHPTRMGLLADYKQMVEDARRFIEERKLVDLTPSGALDVLPTPAFARTNLPFAAYIPAPPFADNGKAQFWVTPTPDDLTEGQTETSLRQHHLGRVLIASVHEAYPGHHVQFSHALKVKRPLRHIFGSNVFLEGWGLYSEELMLREGFKHEDPRFDLLHMSQIRDQLWRALRIVLDVGLHCNGMSQEEATDLLVRKHVLDPQSAASEVMYYCSAPTQPMSYMVGKLLIDDLIKKCRASSDERFQSLPQVHNELLAHGSLPVPLLERAMDVA